MTTAANLYRMPPESETNEVSCLFGPYFNHMEECGVSAHSLYSGEEVLSDRVRILA